MWGKPRVATLDLAANVMFGTPGAKWPTRSAIRSGIWTPETQVDDTPWAGSDTESDDADSVQDDDDEYHSEDDGFFGVSDLRTRLDRVDGLCWISLVVV